MKSDKTPPRVLFAVPLFFVAVSALALAQNEAGLSSRDSRDGNPAPSRDSRWVQPSRENGDKLRWGFREGISVGLTPNRIRGLISIYTPYAGQRVDNNINFFAIEPVAKGETRRGFSELEQSQLDNKQGKRIWTSNDDGVEAHEPRDTEKPAPGVVRMENGEETLTVFFFVEPFRNGARVYVRAKFYASRPYEVEISTHARRDSRELAYCIVTATMGNYARLRRLFLRDGVKTAAEIWPDYAGDAFAPHAVFARERMIAGRDGYPYFVAAPDEKNPAEARHSDETGRRWRYVGRPVVQYWYCKDADDSLQGLVNGRVVYWASKTPIPGGISFENFELRKQFRGGDRFVFGVSPLSAEEFVGAISAKARH